MADRIPSSDITPPQVYFNRRAFMRAGALAAAAVGTGALYRRLNGVTTDVTERPAIPGLVTAPAAGAFRVAEPLTPQASIVNYNNFYEFTTDKEGVAAAAAGFVTAGWTVTVGGLVRKPRVFDLDDLRRLSPPEERIYRMRCVEAWSMVIPWVGYSLSKLLDAVEPTADAKFVVFETLLDPERMPGQTQRRSPCAGRTPKGCGSTRRCTRSRSSPPACTARSCRRRTARRSGWSCRGSTASRASSRSSGSRSSRRSRETTWNIAAPDEYGFYANVNPKHDHPRWSQATEQRIGETGPPRDADVQRLRRPGGEPLRGYGPRCELLSLPPSLLRGRSSTRRS